MKHIYSYTYSHIDSKELINKIQIQYSFLENNKELAQEIDSILNHHHKASFFNKPLVTVDNGLLTVGQAHVD